MTLQFGHSVPVERAFGMIICFANFRVARLVFEPILKSKVYYNK